MTWIIRIAAAALAACLWLSSSAFAQREAVRTVESHASVGQTIRLRGHVNYSHECTEVIPTAISVVQAPRHGDLSIRDEVVRSKDPELGHGSKCAGASGTGKVVYYTRVSPGADVFSYDSQSLNGVVHVHATIK
jgi:hypothetical protein